MIFVSSSCVKAKYIKDSVQQLVEMGFNNIELSGGTQPYEGMVESLLELKDKFNLNYLLHNYFPPPAMPFVVNLAALDIETSEATYSHLQNSLALSSKLGANKFGFHAGFLINIPTTEIGKSISKQKLFDEKLALNNFCDYYNKLKSEADSNNIELYIENNVLSKTNYLNFEKINPFFFTDFDSYNYLAKQINFKPLVDVAHLKVSCHTLELNFEQQLNLFCNISDYIHISDNDGFQDANLSIEKNSEMYDLLSKQLLKNKTITLEVYSGEKDLIKSYQNIEELVK